MAKTQKGTIELCNYGLTGILSVTAIVLLLVWFRVTPEQEIILRIASAPEPFSKPELVTKTVIGSFFTTFPGVPATVEGNWGGFRGPHYDNISHEDIALTDVLDESDLPLTWSKEMGEGYAGAAVKNGCVYVLDYDKKEERDVLRCFSFDDGSEIWNRGYYIPVKRNHGYSRTVPAVSEDYVLALGPKGHVMCVDERSGDFKWGIDLVAEYESKIPLWYTGQCPVIDGPVAVIVPAGTSLLIGVDLETGTVLWKTPNPNKFTMSHSSVIPMTFHGKKMYVYCAIGGMSAVSASGEDRGEILWQTKEWTHSVISPSPVKVSEDRILVTAGYGGGSMMFRILKNESGFEIRKEFALDKSVFACEQQTPIFYNGHLFSILPSDAGEHNRQLVCITPEGQTRWTSGKEHRFGLGPFIIADDKIFILDDDGVLTIARASTESYEQLSRARVLEGRESWGPIAVSEGKILVRDFEELVCLDIRRK